MLNAIGLANPGRARFLAETLPALLELRRPIWVSVGGFEASDYVETCRQLAHHEVACIELNLSCPNVDEAPEGAAEIVAACRATVAAIPLYAKLSPHSWDIAESVRAVESAGADGISLVNTLRGVALDRHLRPTLARVAGGYSGPALKPVALAAVHAARSATELPIVGMGGVQCGRDALELIACGATHVALGTVLFADRDAPERVRAELDDELARAGFASLGEAFCASLDTVANTEN
jgi:dihydroorotate dehydrogenase (NAD+) catalytic subunit